MSEGPPTLGLIDGRSDGHHTTYMIAFCRMALDAGWRVICLFPEPARITAACPAADGRLAVFPFSRQPTVPWSWRLRDVLVPLQRLWRVRRALRAAERAVGRRVHRVFFAYLDDMMNGVTPWGRRLLPWVFPWCWSGLLFFPEYLRLGATGREWQQSYAVALQARNACSVAVLDEGVAAELERRSRRRTVVLPELVEARTASPPGGVADALRARAAGRKVVCAAGALSRRKGILPLLDLAVARPDAPRCYAFVGCLGDAERASYTPEERARIERVFADPPPNVFVHAAFIEEEAELNAVLSCADVLYAVYDAFPHSSGIVAKAAVLQRPVIVADGYCMAERVRRHRLGLVVTSVEPDDLDAAIRTALDPAALRRAIGEPGYGEYARELAPEVAARAFAAVLT